MPLERANSLPTLHEPTLGSIETQAVPASLSRTQSAPDLSGISGFRDSLLNSARHLDEPSEIRWTQMTPMLEEFGSHLDAFNAEMRGSTEVHAHHLTASGLDGSIKPAVVRSSVNEFADAVERALEGGRQSPSRASSDPAVREMETALNAHLNEQSVAVGRELSPHERSVSVFQFLGGGLRAITNNEYQDPRARWAANFANVGVRTGLIVGITTTARQLIGFGIEKGFQLGDSPVTGRELLGASAMAIGMGLNVAGFIRDEVIHAATPQSRAARGAMLAMSLGTLLASHYVGAGSGGETVLSSLMRSFGPQMATYTLARDLAQAFFPLDDNAPINLRGTAAQAAMYGAAQYGLSEAMDHGAPHSGAGFAMSLAAAASRGPNTTAVPDEVTSSVFNWATSTGAPGVTASHESRIGEALRAISPEISHDVYRGLLNATGEVFDDIARRLVARDVHVRSRIEATRNQAIANGENPVDAVANMPTEDTEGLRISTRARIPTANEFANQFLNTNAMRTSAFQVIMNGALTANTLISGTNLSAEAQGQVTNVVVGMLAAAIYGPFLYADVRHTPAEAQSAQTVADEARSTPATHETEIRRRRSSESSSNSPSDESTSLRDHETRL
ncbi:hypothetical protein [Burkholderia ubonensis]|uniref:hypothetical protein n=1 Tax=Burkholderia ubonensis TaxID=101571 RepID=UPI000ACB7A31|nr:hypothetical protein [Burkholderia ubonensis]